VPFLPFRVPDYFGWLFWVLIYAVFFCEISFSCSSHHSHQYGIFRRISFMSLFEYTLFTLLSIYLLVSRIFVRLFSRSVLLYFFIWYSGDFSGLGPVVFVPLLGVYTSKIGVLFPVTFIFLLWNFGLYYASLGSFEWKMSYFSRI